MSLELKLMFAYHGCMMMLFISGGSFSTKQQLIVAGVLVAALITISMRHRRSVGWRWQGVKTVDLVKAVAGVAFTAVFLYAATPFFPASSPRFFPWYLAGLGIGVFNVLQALRLVHPSEAAFLADCREPGAPVEQARQVESTDPAWHKVVRACYSFLSFIVWLGFLAFFYQSGTAFRNGSPVPTTTQTDEVTNHAETAYITHKEKILSDRLQRFAFVGIPSVLGGGFVLHFLVGVKPFPNTPTLQEYWAKRSCGNGRGERRKVPPP